MSRNNVLTFAEYTWANLESIKAAKQAGDGKAHLTTQLPNSLLGMIVFLDAEAKLLDTIKGDPIPADHAWKVLRDGKASSMENLGFLVDHLRNAVAHRDLEFANEEGPSDDIEITATNKLDGETWRVSITAIGLWDVLEWLLKRMQAGRVRLTARNAHRRKPVTSN